MNRDTKKWNALWKFLKQPVNHCKLTPMYICDFLGNANLQFAQVNLTTTVQDCIQFSSVAQSCPTLCDSMNRSTPGITVHHHLPEFTQTHVHWVSDAIQPSHPVSSPSPPAPNPSQHQSQLFAWGGQSTGASALASFLPKYVYVNKCKTYEIIF